MVTPEEDLEIEEAWMSAREMRSLGAVLELIADTLDVTRYGLSLAILNQDKESVVTHIRGLVAVQKAVRAEALRLDKLTSE